MGTDCSGNSGNSLRNIIIFVELFHASGYSSLRHIGIRYYSAL